ncbi:PFA4 [Candida theae]|uniref:Palmitoyltransferase PFA4 n=1 Tax=Candida theae TaxID=1198502 RepID=A0AAD5BBT9_9ASCO|nr:PFA4 [Candida theae]KAI5952972.1 PFA4 [Candida theae]
MHEFRWPLLGVIIPVLIIGFTAYGSHYFILRHHLSTTQQVIYECFASMIWISYIMAIYTSPGHPPKDYTPKKGEWKRYCTKCQSYKPPRTHHCSKCNRCIMEMDHHCPWTLNCVGANNLPHFMRFLFWVIVGTAYLFVQLCERIVGYYDDSDKPMYLIKRSELVAVVVFTPIDLFILLSITVLFIRCLINIGKGMTQIEIWEWDRIDSQFYSKRLWKSIRLSYKQSYGKELPQLTTWTNRAPVNDDDALPMEEMNQHEINEIGEGEALDGVATESQSRGVESDATAQQEFNNDDDDEDEEDIVPQNFTIDDLMFPYDYGVWGNLKHFLGSPFMWLVPWGKPKGNGYDLEPSSDYKEDDQLGLPWPPDGGNQNITISPPSDDELKRGIRNYSQLKKQLDPRSNAKRSSWHNDTGERLLDYGVYVDDSDDDKL